MLMVVVMGELILVLFRVPFFFILRWSLCFEYFFWSGYALHVTFSFL